MVAIPSPREPWKEGLRLLPWCAGWVSCTGIFVSSWGWGSLKSESGPGLWWNACLPHHCLYPLLGAGEPEAQTGRRQETTSSKSDSEIKARAAPRNGLGVSWLLQSREGLGSCCPWKPNASLWQDTLTTLPCDCAEKLNASCADAHLSQLTPEPSTCTGAPAPTGYPPGRSGLLRACPLPLFLT